MTTERNKALSRIRASFAAYRDLEASGGTFQIADINHLLESLEEKEQVLKVVVGDLTEIEDNHDTNDAVGGMINSTLVFVKGYLV